MSEAQTEDRKTSEAQVIDVPSDERVIEKTVDFDAPIERVWTAITSEEELSQWFGQETRLQLTVGFEGAMIWREHGSFALRVEEVAPPHRLVWSWVHEPDVGFDEAPSTRVEWSLTTREGGGTRLHLRESGLRTDKHFGENREGWAEELGELVAMMSM